MEANLEVKNKNRLQLFIENILSYGLISVLGKIVPVIMLPIVTSLLRDTAEFGRYDMFLTIVEFGSNIALLGIYDAMFREFFDKNHSENKKKITSTALYIVLFSSIIVGLIFIITSRLLSAVFFGDVDYWYLIVLASIGVMFVSSRTIISAPTRMENKRNIFLISNVFGVLIYYGISILFVWLGYGYLGLIVANLIYSSLLLVFFSILNKKYFGKIRPDKSVSKNLLKLGIPLMPTFIAYWVFHSMDKIFIANFLGLGQLGIYSVGFRVASISQIVYLAFAGGWQYFAFSTMKDSDQVLLNSKVFEYMAAISGTVFILSLPFYEMVFSLFFEGDYVKGFLVAPYLFIAPLILMLFQISSNQFLIYKKSIFVPLCLFIGLIVNIIANILLTPVIGIEGAAIATVSGYLFSLFSVIVLTKKLSAMNYSFRLIFVLFIVLSTFITHRLILGNHSVIMQFSIIILSIVPILVIYVKDINGSLKHLFKKGFGGQK